MYIHQTELSQMTAAWLLPIVAPIVASATGGIVAEVLPNPHHALWTVIVSYILWGTGVPLAMVVLVIYFQRLTVFSLPPREVIVSVFLPLGPLGQGGFAIMQLGKVAMKVFPETRSLPGTQRMPGDMLYVAGWLIALIMWGFAIVWLFFALASISRSKFPFNMGMHTSRLLSYIPSLTRSVFQAKLLSDEADKSSNLCRLVGFYLPSRGTHSLDIDNRQRNAL